MPKIDFPVNPIREKVYSRDELFSTFNINDVDSYITTLDFKAYSDFKVSEKFTLKDYEGERLALFNEADFLEIAIYKSNPSTVGSATSLLGLKYRDLVTIQFK